MTTAREQLVAHQRAAKHYLDRAAALSPAQWDAPHAPGKWSPAEITEHLRLVYEVVGGEMATGSGGMRLRVPALLRPLIRFRFLRGILRDGQLPEGAKAGSEIRPGGGPFAQHATVDGLRSALATFDRAAEAQLARDKVGFTHHIFGRITGGDAFRFGAVHIEHHLRQLPGPSDR